MAPIQLIAIAVCALVATVSSQGCKQLKADVSWNPLKFLDVAGKLYVYKSIKQEDICDTYIYHKKLRTETIQSRSGREKNYYLSVESNKDLTKTDLVTREKTTIRSLRYQPTNSGSIKISYQCNSGGGFERLYVLVSNQVAIPRAEAIIRSMPGIIELQQLIACTDFP